MAIKSVQEKRIDSIEKALSAWKDAEQKVRNAIEIAFPKDSCVCSKYLSKRGVICNVTGYSFDTDYVFVQNFKTKKLHKAYFSSLSRIGV